MVLATVLFFVCNIYTYLSVLFIMYFIIPIGSTLSLPNNGIATNKLYISLVALSILTLVFIIQYNYNWSIDYMSQPAVDDKEYPPLVNVLVDLIFLFIKALLNNLLLLPFYLLLFATIISVTIITCYNIAKVLSTVNNKSVLLNMFLVFISFAFYPVGMWYIHPQLNKLSQ